jgi:hypothetical protein
MSISAKDFGWQDQYSDAMQVSGLIAKNSNHIWDYMWTRPKYTNPLMQWQAYHKYSPRLLFSSEKILNSELYSPGKFDPVGIDEFSNKCNAKNKAIVESAFRL